MKKTYKIVETIDGKETVKEVELDVNEEPEIDAKTWEQKAKELAIKYNELAEKERNLHKQLKVNEEIKRHIDEQDKMYNNKQTNTKKEVVFGDLYEKKGQ